MNTRPFSECPDRSRRRRNRPFRGPALRWVCARLEAGFTLLEVLVVIGIMGIVAAVSLPAIKSWNRSNTTTAASRQLLDDLALARQRAISTRSTVYVVFQPPAPWLAEFGRIPLLTSPPWDPRDLPLLTNLLSAPYASYALFARRQSGDQPGVTNAQFITAWKMLPEGTFIATNKFTKVVAGIPPLLVNGVRPFTNTVACPFPSSTSPVLFRYMPCVGFDSQGRLLGGSDEVIPLARGTVYPGRGTDGQITIAPPSLSENPPFNSINQSNHIRVDLLTGRARVEKWEMP